ncbi:hypothetical protein C8A05DRAFT_38195 [Staphylotrichum tortipilum]|uniref:NmrA-like domain-containing protein n=1 Tax=Staphylotrichum tortipilum TaxID=2831512 RepID=A0AAN6ME13_9PEZI|nr:hypothetical protein C8A05DRAFT_38195 [Staphylotrichum longicolle]
MAPPNVFVCTATGTQGGAVARALLALGWSVTTTTRDPSSPAAQALAAQGVTVHAASSFLDNAALVPAISGCDLLFLNVLPVLTDPALEATHAKNLLSLAAAAGIRHVVYSTSLVLPEPPGTAALLSAAAASKREVEVHLASLSPASIPTWTVLRPGFFMTNFLLPLVSFLYPGAVETGVFTLAFAPDTPLPMVDPKDIGAFAAAAFQDPHRFGGKEIDLVSEVVEVERAMEVMRKGTGKGIKARYLGDGEVEEATKVNPMLIIQKQLREVSKGGVVGDVERVKSWGVEVGTFEGFVERERVAFGETYRALEV